MVQKFGMKKILVIIYVVSIFFLSIKLLHAEEKEDLSKVNINQLTSLQSNEIVEAISNKKLFGYTRIWGFNILIEDIHYEDGDYIGYSTMGTVTGKWKVNDNRLCYKANKSDFTEQEKMFTCNILVYTKNNNELYFYTLEQGIYGKVTSSVDLIN